MKIALIGYGKMGRAVEEAAIQRGHSIDARISSKKWDSDALAKADLCIDFTCPEAVLENVKKITDLKKPLVIGTTGWDKELDQVRSIVMERDAAVLYSANFSIGIHILLELVEHASKITALFEEYDVAGIESHHANKKDAPSGTALEIAKILRKNVARMKEFSFTSVRCGSIPGIHTLLFDSPSDTLTISHEARNREGFARGALYAAEWLIGKQGLFTFSDCLEPVQNL